jgi:hypothetical protein
LDIADQLVEFLDRMDGQAPPDSDFLIYAIAYREITYYGDP